MELYQANSAERLPAVEARERIRRCLEQLRALVPAARGLLVFSEVNIYYLSGTLNGGVLWLPHEGKPVLLVRKGLARARAESPLEQVVPFRSYGELAGLCAAAGAPLPAEPGALVAVNMGGLLWSQAELLKAHLPNLCFAAGDLAIKRARMRKSAWELTKMRQAGARHQAAIQELARQIHPGLSEWDMAEVLHALFTRHGHCGLARVTPPGRVSLGAVAVGDSGLYPTSFDGPLGVLGCHPAAPYQGSMTTMWERGQLLTVDSVFCFEGYCTDKTQCFWGGSEKIPALARAAQDCCLEIHARAATLLTPGTPPSALWEMALRVAREHGFADRFMGCGPEAVRFLGHGIGLEMDEFPAIAARFDLPLEAGMCLAVEPKIGLPGIGMVGVENTFEVTGRGGVCLTGGKGELIQIG